MAAARVLVVDDHPGVRDLVASFLRRRGYQVQEESDGLAASSLLAADVFDLVVLDVCLPGLDGIEVLRRLRTSSDVPVIMLSGRTAEADRVAGLEQGADDYMVKPFSARELEARIRSVLGRSARAAAGGGGRVLEFPGLRIDIRSREVERGRRVVATTPREFDLLAYLAGVPRRVVSREELLERVWSSSPAWQDPNTVTEHIRRLRLKLEDDPASPRILVAVRGVGYRFEPPAP
jgi:two-component system, OmpR family, response regulator ResD